MDRHSLPNAAKGKEFFAYYASAGRGGREGDQKFFLDNLGKLYHKAEP
jgi:hypothetical protein